MIALVATVDGFFAVDLETEEAEPAEPFAAAEPPSLNLPRIVAAAPLVALVGLRVTNPHYVSIFDGMWGQMVLIGCASSIALGYAAMLYLTRLPGQRRVLVR